MQGVSFSLWNRCKFLLCCIYRLLWQIDDALQGWSTAVSDNKAQFKRVGFVESEFLFVTSYKFPCSVNSLVRVHLRWCLVTTEWEGAITAAKRQSMKVTLKFWLGLVSQIESEVFSKFIQKHCLNNVQSIIRLISVFTLESMQITLQQSVISVHR